MEIKEMIKKIREKTGLSQLKLAKLLDIPQSELSYMSRGFVTPKEERIQKIIDLYNQVIKQGE